MSRIVKPPDVRRQELIEIALKQFAENGYEKTSIRSILKEADGEIGMFYHYFKSKHEIYVAALEEYNEKYIAKVTEIVNASSLNFKEKLNLIFLGSSGSVHEYSLLCTKKANPEIMTILLAKTLLKMAPLFELLILDGLKNNIMKAPMQNTRLLSKFILFGISAILHDTEVSSMEEKIGLVKKLIEKILDVDVGGI
ncbi:MAG: TetR/AcrR family transcriptional regulator [Clostridiales bacterium]|nr:TetR/AcrR family transcriptional regulator [Clostridiales bacterium]